MNKRTTTLINPQMLDQLSDLLMPRLEERLANHLASKQRGEGSNPSDNSAKLARTTAFADKYRRAHAEYCMLEIRDIRTTKPIDVGDIVLHREPSSENPDSRDVTDGSVQEA